MDKDNIIAGIDFSNSLAALDRAVDGAKPKNPHAQALGSLGGQSKSEAKKEASRLNGKKGGRPRNKPVDNSENHAEVT